MIVGVLKEPSFESRVSLLAETAAALIKKGVTILVETNAGQRAACDDAAYRNAGAALTTREEVIHQSDVILSIHPPFNNDITSVKGKVCIGIYQPLFHPELMRQC